VPQVCSVCAHSEAFAINEALVIEKRSNRSIAKQYSFNHNAVQRHRAHIPELLVKASEAMEVADADELLERIQGLYEEAMAVLEAGKDSDDYRLVLSAIDRAGKQLEILAEMRGTLDRRPQVNFILTEEWVRIRTTLVTALEPFPEARVAVASRLLELEEGNGS
jgi:hypothetical protein